MIFWYCDVVYIEINNKSKCNCIKGFYIKSFIGVMVLLNYFEFENYEFEFG